MARQSPNLVLITTDQQRYDTVAPFKPGFLRTPHLDQLARQGTTFTWAYADCPVCVPSRVTIMSGKSVFRHGMNGNGQTGDVLGRDDTLPARLRELGYHTAAVGKMHFGPQRLRHGFDEMIIPEDYYRQMQRRPHDTLPMRHGLGQNELYPGLATVPEPQTLTAWTVDQCVDYIRERRDPSVPFFLWCSFAKPHPPLDPPEPYYSMYQHSPIPEPVESEWSKPEAAPSAFRADQLSRSYDQLDPEVIRAARAAYDGLVTQIDYNLGRLFASLLEMGIDDNTLILFASDHGEYLGDHGSGGKRHFHEASAHVPMILRLPPAWDGPYYADQDDRLVTLADILPTMVSAAGGNASDVDGQDLGALLRGDLTPRASIEATSGATGGEPLYYAITDGRWKYIWYPDGPVAQLFDLADDPHERDELASDPAYAQQTNRMHQWLRERLQRHDQDNTLPHRRDGRLNEADARYANRLGLRTEYFHKDVRH